jgi:hypothetical protein
MGRGEEENIDLARRRGPKSLSVGRDNSGNEVRIGDTDSSGYPVGFISEDGQAWQDITEHDEVRTVSALEEEMFLWQEGRRAAGLPNPEEIARKTCLDERNILHATKEAIANWDDITRRRQAEMRNRDENFRLFIKDLDDIRYPLFEEGRTSIYPSKIDNAEIHIDRITDTAEEKEEIQKRLQEITERLKAAGLPMPPDEIIKAIIEGDGDIFSRINKDGSFDENGSEENEEFNAIVAGLETGAPAIVWSSQLEIPFGGTGDSLAIGIERASKEEAYESTLLLEDIVARGPLTDEPVALRVIGKSPSPEAEKAYALEILAQGEDHPDIKRAEALGIRREALLEKARQVAMGDGGDRAFVFASAQTILPSLGMVRIHIAGETEDEALRRVRLVFPKAELAD